MKSVLFAVFTFAATSVATLADNTWLPFSDPKSGFTADLPGTPTVTHTPSKSADGHDVDTATYDVLRDTYELTVVDTYGTDLQMDAGQAVDRGVEIFKTLVVQIVSDSICTLDGQVGREIVGVDKDGNRLDERIFGLNNHLYQVITVKPKGADDSAAPLIQHFVASFRFTAH